MKIKYLGILVSSIILFNAGRIDCFNPDHVNQIKQDRGMPDKPMRFCGSDEHHRVSCDLSGADLQNAHLYDADLGQANLTGTKFQGADLGFADLTGATGANLTGAHFYYTTMPDGSIRHQ